MFKRHLIPSILLFAIVVSLPTAILSSAARVSADESTALEESVKPGINDRFLDPELAIDEWIGRFEIESREVFSARERVLAACKIEKGNVIADVGAGTGFYSRLFAEATGTEGWVYSVDISPKFLAHINKKTEAENIGNISCILGTGRSTRLPKNTVDVVFICDTYHHFEFPQSTLASILTAMKPGARLVVIDFERIPGESREFILGHVRAGKSTFRSEIEKAGFKFVDEVTVPGFKENYLLRFEKP